MSPRRLALVPVLALLLPAVAGCGGGSRARTTSGATGPSGHRAEGGHATAAVRAPSTVAASLGAHPLRGAAARRAAVPILMYHVVNAPPPGTPNAELWVAPSRFAAEMRALAAGGYRGVTLKAVLAAWRTGAPLPRRPVVVSFDDGYLSQYTKAFPVLRRLGWPGVLNLEVHNVAPDNLPPGLVRRLVAAGWEIDSHTISHPDLTTLPSAVLRRELVGSRAWIRTHLGVAAAAFCYPAGRYDARVEAAVRAAGYVAATTTQPGWARPGDDRFAMPRVRVDGSDTAATLLEKLAAERSAAAPGPVSSGSAG